MKNSHLPIDQRHKQLLRATLLEVHSARTLPVDRKHPFSFMKTFFRWSLVPAVAVASFGAWMLFAPQSPAQSGLAGVRAALAAEATQAAQHLVHHQKIQISDSTRPDSSATEEYWISDEARATTYTSAAGIVDDRLLTVYNADSTVKQLYSLHPSTLPISEDLDADVRCVINVRDLQADSGAAGAQEKAGSLIDAERVSDRQALVQALLNDSSVQDLGERDGKHLFSITMTDESVVPAETTLYEYAFDPTTFSLMQYTVRYFAGTSDEYAYTYMYLVNEYVNENQIPENTWSTAGLTEISDAVQKLADKASGCYDASGAKVSDVKFTTQTMQNGRLGILINADENPHLDDMIFSENSGNDSIFSITVLSNNPSAQESGESTMHFVTGE